MADRTVLKSGSLAVFDYRCTAGPHDRPYVEMHGGYSVSYVRRGSFGCKTQGGDFELVAGSILQMLTHGDGTGEASPISASRATKNALSGACSMPSRITGPPLMPVMPLAPGRRRAPVRR